MGEIKNSELFQRLKVYFLDMLQSSAGGPGPYSPTPHGLQSSHHTGAISDSQATQFLKTDGTRQLVGSLGVAAGVLIDGVDISEFKNTYDAHALGAAAVAHNGVGVHNHQASAGGGQLDHGLALSGLSDDDHLQYASSEGYGTRRAYEAGRLNLDVTAGNGLTGGGKLTSNITLSVKADDGIDVGTAGVSVDCTDLLGAGIAEDTYNNFIVDVTADFTWTGIHTFDTINLFGQTNAQHILPRYTDTYDLGSSTLLWRKGWLSELDTVLFAQNTVTLLGGWLLISKDEGALPADVAAADTQINFGKAMTVNDFVLFRAAGKVEYMQIGALVSGTIYNVTRDLDGSGADDWAGGNPFCVLGASGNGRIELNSYNTPRISLINQGATYNAQTELIRLGDLNGQWGYAAATYGLAIGEYASGKVNMTLDPTNSLRIRTYDTVQFSVTPNLLKFGANVSAAGTTALSVFGADQTYNSESVGVGDLLIGDNSTNKANILWDKSVGKLLFRGGTTTQIYVDTTGALSWGGGIGVMDANGIYISVAAEWEDKNAYAFKSGSNYVGGMYSVYYSVVDMYKIALVADATGRWKEESGSMTEGNAQIEIKATSHDQTYQSAASLMAINYNDVGDASMAGILCNTSYGSIIYGKLYVGAAAGESVVWSDTLKVDGDICIFGVKDNVLVVDTTNGRVGVNCQPSYPLHVTGASVFTANTSINVSSTTALKVENTGTKNNVLVVDTTNGRVGVNCAPSYPLHVTGVAVHTANMFINDTSNANMSLGLTINQGSNDNEIIALKSSDVAHGVTGVTETDSFCVFQKYSADGGGLIIRGLNEEAVGACIVGYGATAETARAASAGAKVLVNGYQTSGTSVTNATSDMNVFAIRTYRDGGTKTIFIVDEDGDVFVDGSTSLTAFDEYDDVKLLTGLRVSLMSDKTKLQKRFGEWMEYAKEPLSNAGIVTYNDDGHHFLSLKGLHMLEIDAIRQMSDKINDLMTENTILKEKLDYVNSRLMLLTGGT